MMPPLTPAQPVHPNRQDLQAIAADTAGVGSMSACGCANQYHRGCSVHMCRCCCTAATCVEQYSTTVRAATICTQAALQTRGTYSSEQVPAAKLTSPCNCCGCSKERQHKEQLGVLGVSGIVAVVLHVVVFLDESGRVRLDPVAARWLAIGAGDSSSSQPVEEAEARLENVS